MRRLLILVSAVSLGSLLFATPAASQSTRPRGSLRGTVTDFTDGALKGAKVAITLTPESGTSPTHTLETQADSEGTFEFTGVPAGEGLLVVKLTGFGVRKRVVRITAGAETVANVRLGVPCDEAEGEAVRLSDRDRAEIVRWLLENVRIVTDGRILSTANLRRGWIAGLSKELVLTTPAAIRRRARHEDLFYLEVPPLSVRGGCVSGTVALRCMSGGRLANMCDEGYTYEFSRVNGRWVGEYVIGWIASADDFSDARATLAVRSDPVAVSHREWPDF